MFANPLNDTGNPSLLGPETGRLAPSQQSLFAELTQLETLHAAYSKLNEALAPDSPLDRSQAPLSGDEVSAFLQQLGEDLRTGTFRAEDQKSPPAVDQLPDGDARTNLRNRVVQIALSNALERIFPTDEPANPVARTAEVITQGLSRVYSVTISESEADRDERILAIVRQHVDDPAFLTLLGNVLKSIEGRDTGGSNPLASVLTRIVLHNIDQVLHQANVLGRQGSYIHATCVRFDHDVAIFLDYDAQYDWLLPAVQKRLREGLAEIQVEIDPEKTQSVDLARGEKLHFLDYEFRLVKERDGTARVQYKSLVKTGAPKPVCKDPSRCSWKLPSLRWPRRLPRRKRQAVGTPGRRLPWLALELRWPALELRWRGSSWNGTLKVPRRGYVLAVGVLIGAAVLAVLVPFLWSQGPQLYPVRGRVFYEGRPAVGALVVFHPKNPTSARAPVASARVGEEGSFVLGTYQAEDGAPAGSYVVTICRPRGKGPNALPARYASRQTTPLVAIVKQGPTEVPIFQLQVIAQ